MEDTVLPLSNPIAGLDGKEIKEIFLPRDTNLIISIISSNTNKALWGPDAEEWKPERWLSPLPDSLVNAHLPGVYAHLYVSGTCLASVI